MNCTRDRLLQEPERQAITVEINAADVPAFNEFLNEFSNGVRYQAIVARKQADRQTQIESLRHLYTLTQTHWKTGQARVIASFLACLYNGYRFQFDLTDFRTLDSDIFEQCLNVLRLDSQPTQEVHCYFERGGELWEHMIEDYGIEDRTSPKALAEGD